MGDEVAVAGEGRLQPKELGANPKMAWVGDFSPGAVKAIGSLALLAVLKKLVAASHLRRRGRRVPPLPRSSPHFSLDHLRTELPPVRAPRSCLRHDEP